MHRVTFVVCPRFELLELAGPAAVFDAANHALQEAGLETFYAVDVVSSVGGLVTSHAGLSLATRAVRRTPTARIDTLLIVGTPPDTLRSVTSDPAVRQWARVCAKTAVRVGSVCTGAFILAGAGLLDGKRAATHWAACRLLAEMYPSISVDADALYVMDGRFWTSAGVTAGVDMALAMVAEDVGQEIASQVAMMLVLYSRRPGHQSQFSPLLLAQANADAPFADLIDWLQANIGEPCNVASLAARAGLSERSFHRKFTAATGETPARFVEALRLDIARHLLTNNLSLKAVAKEAGFTSSARLAKAFERRFGVTPSLFREIHAAP